MTEKKATEQGAGYSNPTIWIWLFIGALIIFGATNFLNTIRYRADYKSIEKRYQQLIADRDSIASELSKLNNKYVIVQNIQNQRILLKGTEKAPLSKAIIYNDTIERKTYISIIKLNRPPANHQYQLWGFAKDQPTEMGVIDPSSTTELIEVQYIPNASTFATTIEPFGGSSAPSLDQIILIGNIR